MQTTERRLIEDLFDRLRDAEARPRDAEAERLIAEQLRRVPHAPYTMAQTIIAQNQALETAAARIEALESGERYEGQPVPGAMGAPDLGRGAVPRFPPDAGRQGGGFLAGAGQVALGMAGGMLMGEAAKSLLGMGSEAQAATGALDAAPSADNALVQDAGVNDVAGAEGGAGGEGGGGLFGWLFGGGSQDTGSGVETADSGWDSGGWDDGGGDGGGD